MEKSIPKSLETRCNRDRKKEKAKKLTNSSLSRCPFACGVAALLMSRWQALRLVLRCAQDCRIASQFRNCVALSSVRNVSRPVSKLPPAQLLHPTPLVETRNFGFVEQKDLATRWSGLFLFKVFWRFAQIVARTFSAGRTAEEV